MAEDMSKKPAGAEEEMEEVEIYTLQDENGKQYQFELLETYEKNGVEYYAMIPADEAESGDGFMEYTILKVVVENGERNLISIDDDDEFEDVAAYFDNLFSEEIDYDTEGK